MTIEERARAILNDSRAPEFENAQACLDYMTEHEADMRNKKFKDSLPGVLYDTFGNYKIYQLQYTDTGLDKNLYLVSLASELRRYDISEEILKCLYGKKINPKKLYNIASACKIKINRDEANALLKLNDGGAQIRDMFEKKYGLKFTAQCDGLPGEELLDEISNDYTTGGQRPAYYAEQLLNKWLSGEATPTREYCVKLCFALKMTAQEAEDFLRKVGEYPLNVRDAQESVWFYCLLHDRPYRTALRLLYAYEAVDISSIPQLKYCRKCEEQKNTSKDRCPICGDKLEAYIPTGNTTKIFRSSNTGGVGWKWKDDEDFFENYLVKNKIKFTGISNNAYDRYMQEKERLVNLMNEKSNSTSQRDLLDIAAERPEAKSVLKNFFDSFPFQNDISYFERGKISNTSNLKSRKLIVYFFFLRYILEWENLRYKLNNESNIDLPDTYGFDNFIKELEELLKNCQLSPIDLRQQFDFLICWAVRRFDLCMTGDEDELNSFTEVLEEASKKAQA